MVKRAGIIMMTFQWLHYILSNSMRVILISLFILFTGCVKNTDIVAPAYVVTCLQACETVHEECHDTCFFGQGGGGWYACVDICDECLKGCEDFCYLEAIK